MGYYTSEPAGPPAGPGLGWLVHLIWIVALIAIGIWVIKHFAA
jgi:flagellar biogenesis protein FliO